MGDLLNLILMFFGIFVLAKLVSFMMTHNPSQNSEVDPDPCPPHDWETPKEKIVGVMYQCAKCGWCFPIAANQGR